MSEIDADSEPEANVAANGQSSESSLVGIFLRELERLRRIVAGMGLGASDGEDILQDVWIKALRWSGKRHSEEQYVRWLIKVTVNRCLTEHRRKRSFRRHACEILRRSEHEIDATGIDEKAIIAEELEIVRETLQELDESLLMPLVLRYFCGLDSREVGEILNLRPSTVRGRMRRARMTLAKELMKRGFEP